MMKFTLLMLKTNKRYENMINVTRREFFRLIEKLLLNIV